MKLLIMPDPKLGLHSIESRTFVYTQFGIVTRGGDEFVTEPLRCLQSPPAKRYSGFSPNKIESAIDCLAVVMRTHADTRDTDRHAGKQISRQLDRYTRRQIDDQNTYPHT